MSRKSVPFSVPEGATRPAGDRRRLREPEFIDAHTDDWVSDRNSAAKDPSTGAGPRLFLDLAAERTLMEIAILCMLTPMTLGWVWLLNAMSGRVRF